VVAVLGSPDEVGTQARDGMGSGALLGHGGNLQVPPWREQLKVLH
jgi:hypothetical protein